MRNQPNAIQNNTLWHIPSRNQSFIGREAELDQLSDLMEQHHLVQITQPDEITCGGVGKTQLSFEFAFKSIEQNKYPVVIYLNAAQDLYLGLIDFARKHFQLDFSGQNRADIISAIQQEINKKGKALFIFDNANNLNFLEEFRNSEQDTIVISKQKLGLENAGVVECPFFTEDESVKFISKKLNLNAMQQQDSQYMGSVKALANRLKHIPLALSLALATIKFLNINLTQYFSTEAIQKLANADFQMIIDKTFKFILFHITNNLQRAAQSRPIVQLLALLTYCPADHIPTEWFVTWLNNNQQAYEQILAFLINLDLIQANETLDHVTIHPILQELMQNDSPPQQKIIYLQLLSGLNEKSFDAYATSVLLPFLKQIPQLFAQTEKHEKLLADYHGTIGNAETKKELEEKVETNKANPIEALHKQGIEFYKQQKYNEAINVFTQSLELQNSVEIINQQLKATTLFKLGSAYHLLEEFDKAIETLTAAENIHIENKTQASPQANRIKQRISLCSSKQEVINKIKEGQRAVQRKDFDSANHIFIEVMKRNKDLYPGDNLRFAGDNKRIALCLMQNNQFTQVDAYLNTAEEIYKTELKANDPEMISLLELKQKNNAALDELKNSLSEKVDEIATRSSWLSSSCFFVTATAVAGVGVATNYLYKTYNM